VIHTEARENEKMESNDVCPEGPTLAILRQHVVVIVSSNPAIRNQLSRLLLEDSVDVILLSGLEEFKIALEYEKVVACLCGFHLTNGTPRDVIAQAHQQPIDIPVVMVSTPASATEFDEFLASLNVGAFDFIRHPFRPTEVRNIVWSAIEFHGELARVQTSQKRNSSNHRSQIESQLSSLANEPEGTTQPESAACGQAQDPEVGPPLPFRR
jgi:DNA-binding NtrC family response regulator